ncbi:hypothetical protein K438DRAFT_2029062 [Mycena galopus ATCC 62051]|nr:hypothetical protein K438DRAFT_2029062 [Mycena galopus ATCC 62051]
MDPQRTSRHGPNRTHWPPIVSGLCFAGTSSDDRKTRRSARMVRTVPIGPIWPVATFLLTTLCTWALVWTLARRPIRKCTNLLIYLFSMALNICGGTLASPNSVVTFSFAYQLAVPTSTSRPSHSTPAPGPTASGATFPVATGNHGASTQARDPHAQGRRGHTGQATGSSNGVTTRDATETPAAEVKIMYWNIYHNFTLKLTSPEFHSLLKPYDIMFFVETDMLPGEEDPADVPRGYSLISLPRKPRPRMHRRGGGITLFIRNDIEFIKSHLSSPDILVLDLGSMWLIGAYIPPVTSRWEGWTDVEPIQQLWETVALCTPSADKSVLLLTDINGRTGSQQVLRLLEAWPRNLSDVVENTRGTAILDKCDKFSLCILNGKKAPEKNFSSC